MDNRTIAQRLLAMAHNLEHEHASLYRVQAYRRAAETILGLERSVADIVALDGRKALRELPGIGAKMSVRIETLARADEIANVKEDSLIAKVWTVR
jgi:DNA polymerase/3'-5' exonuclease PolX